jgi:hypothetical protein
VYQDLYGEGIFAGKGIYEVDTVHRVLDRRFPRNALLSHDLIEGAYARAGLVSDIEIIEDYPSHYSAYNRRKHRWLRGDWQITGWLLSRVPDESGRKVPNPISLVSQWKILDNLRRSLVEPATFLLLVFGWLVLAVGLEIASCLGYVAVVRLVIRNARAREVRRLAWAEQAFGLYVLGENSHAVRALSRAAMLDVLRFWLDLGIDGFRLDAVPYLYARDGTNCENLPETHAFLRRCRKVLEDEYPGRVMLAEANQWPSDVVEYFGDPEVGGDECHMAFHFPLMPRIFMAVRRENRFPISEILAQTPAIPSGAQWGIFLRNHDELTLEMVTDEERDYMYAEYAKDPRMKANIGIRRRLAPLLENDRNQLELFTALQLSLTGSPVLYYGDEIGMGDNIWLGDRDAVRSPMQWTPDRNAGFSSSDPGRIYLPPIMDPLYGYQAVNVEAQLNSTTSLLHWNRHMI